MVFEKSSFEPFEHVDVGNGADADCESNPKFEGSKPRKTVQIVPLSALSLLGDVDADKDVDKDRHQDRDRDETDQDQSQVFIRLRRKTQKQEKTKLPDPDQVLPLVGNPKELEKNQKKPKADQEESEDESEDDDSSEDDNVGDYDMEDRGTRWWIKSKLGKLEYKEEQLEKFKSLLKENVKRKVEAKNQGGSGKDGQCQCKCSGRGNGNGNYSLLVVSILLLIFMLLLGNIVICVKQNKNISESLTANLQQANLNLNLNQNQNQKDIAKEKLTERIFLYSQKNYKGTGKFLLPGYLNDNPCYNLDSTANNFASSIDTQGQCVYVFEAPNCQGRKYKFGPETHFQHDLTLWGLDKEISSIQACSKHQA